MSLPYYMARLASAMAWKMWRGADPRRALEEALAAHPDADRRYAEEALAWAMERVDWAEQARLLAPDKPIGSVLPPEYAGESHVPVRLELELSGEVPRQGRPGASAYRTVRLNIPPSMSHEQILEQIRSLQAQGDGTISFNVVDFTILPMFPDLPVIE